MNCLFAGDCANQPPKGALEKGWTCQHYFDNGDIPKRDFCSRDDWIKNETCGDAKPNAKSARGRTESDAYSHSRDMRIDRLDHEWDAPLATG